MTEEPPRQLWVVRFLIGAAWVAFFGVVAAAIYMGVLWGMAQLGFSINAIVFMQWVLAVVFGGLAYALIWSLNDEDGDKTEN